jgi:hypothetical protein
MEEAPENTKKSLNSAHANGMNEPVSVTLVTIIRVSNNMLVKNT